MVTRGNIDWEQHKKDVLAVYTEKVGAVKAQQFVDYYAKVYDNTPMGYNYLPHEICWSLYDDYNLVAKSGIRWYGFVGTGGTGKTTLGKNVFYFLDPSFDVERIVFTANDFIKVLSEFPLTNAMKSELLDEPDGSIHPNSIEGRGMRSILGKARQQKLFLGFCATDMRDIPDYIYKKLSAIFFTPQLGEAWLFKDHPKKQRYVIVHLKNEYQKHGYGAFIGARKRFGCLRFATKGVTPLSQEKELKYLDTKSKDYHRDIHDFLSLTNGQETQRQTISDRDKLVIYSLKNGISPKELAKVTGKDISTFSLILKKHGLSMKELKNLSFES